MLACIDSIYICSFIRISFFIYQYFELYDILCYLVICVCVCVFL